VHLDFGVPGYGGSYPQAVSLEQRPMAANTAAAVVGISLHCGTLVKVCFRPCHTPTAVELSHDPTTALTQGCSSRTSGRSVSAIERYPYMQVLLTFTGFHDPYVKGLVGQEEQPGPILSLVSVRSFEHIILFSTPSTVEHTQATKEALETLYPELVVEMRDLPLDDPTNYNAILRGLRTHIPEVCDKFSPAQFCIAVASGTPQMHACWVLLAASGEIPAHILHVRPPRFVSKDRPLVSEVDLTSADFPLVRAHVGGIETPYDLPNSTV